MNVLSVISMPARTFKLCVALIMGILATACTTAPLTETDRALIGGWKLASIECTTGEKLAEPGILIRDRMQAGVENWTLQYFGRGEASLRGYRYEKPGTTPSSATQSDSNQKPGHCFSEGTLEWTDREGKILGGGCNLNLKTRKVGGVSSSACEEMLDFGGLLCPSYATLSTQDRWIFTITPDWKTESSQVTTQTVGPVPESVLKSSPSSHYSLSTRFCERGAVFLVLERVPPISSK